MADYRALFRGTPGSVRIARRAIIDYARLCGFQGEPLHEIALAAGEALANAVEHGNKDLGFIEVSCTFGDDRLVVEISDAGAGFDITNVTARRRDPSAIRGFGISIMYALMDDVRYERRGALVRLTKHLRAGAESCCEEA